VSDLTRTQQEALAPVRRALLDAARDEAETRRAAAEEDARAVRAEADERAAGVLAEARRRGEADGADRVRSERAAARREARAVVQRARQESYDRVREAAVGAVGELLDHAAARDRLRALVVEELGEDARFTEAPGGGVVGEAPDGRRVDASATRLVDLAMDRVDLEGLWSS
jgi:flagellar biosynthesis/type III secretory pathway protein FliH